MKANKVPSERYTRTNGVIVEVYNRMEAALTKTKLTPDTVVYHGTAATFDKFALIKRNPTTPVDEVNAFFFTTDPRVAYGHARRMAKENGGKIRVIAAKLKFKSLQDMTARIKRYQREIGNFGQAKRKAYAEVDSTKHDGIEFRGDSVNTPEYVVFNPDVIDVLSHGWSENKQNYLEASLGTVYHYTSTYGLRDILKDNRFRLTTNMGTKTDAGEKPFFLSLTRSKVGGYHTRAIGDSGVLLDLNYDYLASRYKIGPRDYWGREFRKHDQKMNEMEETLLSKDQFVPLPSNTNDLINSVHILSIKKQDADILRSMVIDLKKRKVPVYIYNNSKDWLSQRPLRALRGQELFDLLNVATKAPYHSNKRRNYVAPYLELYNKPANSKLSKEANDLRYKIKYDYGDEAYKRLEIEIHNMKTRNEIGPLIKAVHKLGGITSFIDFIKDKYKDYNMEASTGVYGYWFTHTGERVEVKPYEHDIEAARIIVKNYNKQYMMFNKNGRENYKVAAFKLFGWIRTVNEREGISVEAWPDNVAPEAFDAFSKYIKNEVFDQIILGWARSNNSGYVQESDNKCDKVLRALYKARPMYNREGKDIITVESMDDAYGYWITANGEMLPVEHQSHNTVAEKYIVRNLYNEYFNFVMENDSQDFNTFCLTQGWLRLILLRETLGIQLFKESVAAPAFRALTRYVEGQAFERVSIDVVSRRLGTEFMNEENRSFDIESGIKRRQASAFIRSQLRKNTLEAAAKSEVYGYWITADGELLIIKDEKVGHIGTFKKYIKRENKQSEYTKDDIDSIEDLEYWPVLTRGWIRIVFEGYNIMNTEIFKKRVSPKAFSRFKSLLAGLDVNQMFLDINIDKSISNIDFESFDKKHALVKALEQNVVKELTAEELLEASTSEPYFTSKALREVNEEADNPKSRTTLIMMKPSDFLKMAYNAFDENKYRKAKQLNSDRIQYNSVPYLIFENSGDGTAVVTGHEGRHRSLVLKQLGDKPMPVAFKSSGGAGGSIRWGSQEGFDKVEVWPTILIGEGNNSSNKVPFPDSEYYPRYKKLEALDESDNTFEAWITDKGVVASPISHMRTLKSIMAKDKTMFERLKVLVKRDRGFNSNAEAYAFGTRQLGFIRVVGSEKAPSIMFAKNSVHPEVYRLFSKYFRDRVEPTTLVFTDALEFPYEEDNYGSTVEFKEFRQQAPLFAWVRANVKKTNLEAAEKWDSNAWWITNEGKVIEVGAENEHGEFAQPYFDKKKEKHIRHSTETAIANGWVRLRKDGNYMYVIVQQNKLSLPAYSAVLKLLKDQAYDSVNLETFGKRDTYEEYTNNTKFNIALKQNITKEKEMQKTIVAIDGDNNVDWVSKEEILETWRTDNKNERIDLVQRKTDYLVREFNPEGELTQESVYKFKETASDYLLQTVRGKQSANIFFSKQSDLNMEAADLEQFIERWESVDGKYATALGKGEFGFFIKDYVKNQITQTFKNVSNYSLGRKTLAESEAEFKNHLTLVQKSGTQYKKVDGNKSFVTPKESKKLADAQVKVRGNSETKALDGFKPFSKQPTIPGLQVVTKKTGSYIYAKVLHRDSGLTLVNITNSPLGFSPSELVTRIDNSDLSAFDWTLPSKELFSRYGNSELLQAARKFYDSLSESMKDKTDKELEGVLQNVVKDYVISKLMGLPKRAKNTRQRIDAVIKAKGLDAAKVYNYFGNVDDRTKSGRDQLLKNVGLTRVAGGYDLIKNTVKPAPEPIAAKPKPIPDKISARIAFQRNDREAAQSDKIIMPPKTGGVDDSMIGQYVVGLDGKNELRGIVLKQVRDKRTGRSSGQVVVLTNDSDPGSYNVYTLSNLKRTLKKPPKALISAFNIVSARNRMASVKTR